MTKQELEKFIRDSVNNEPEIVFLTIESDKDDDK